MWGYLKILMGLLLLGGISADALAAGRWQQVDNKANCAVWNNYPQAVETVIWTGGCVAHKAGGYGELKWRYLVDEEWKEQNYEGLMREGKQHGHGIYVWANGDRYEGGFKEGMLHGHGVFVWANGDRYEGGYKEDMLHGHGVFVGENGDKYEGDYKNDKKHGRGVYVWLNGDIFDGDYRGGFANGNGTLTLNGESFSGYWTNGCFRQGNRSAAIGVTIEACGFE